jgi:hypothetical protein
MPPAKGRYNFSLQLNDQTSVSFFLNTFSNESNIFGNMKRMKLITVLWMMGIGFYSGCAPAKQQSQVPEKKLPGTIAMSPSSFRCEGVVIESNSKSVKFAVSKILEQGSSLFYSVSAGDTIQANFQSLNKTNYPPVKNVELLIEERVMLNSEKPEFIVREIKDK